ncbi:MAG: lysoplasmalogenase [Gemmatimonadales bacterium]
MPLIPIALPALAATALSAALHLRAHYRGPPWQVYLFKPLTIAILLLLAATGTSPHGPRYQLAIVAGLSCSLVGDVMLMLPGDRLVPGLAAFLVAHLAYLVAFASGIPFGSAPALLIPLLLIGALLLRLLWPGLGSYRGPVLAYTVAILLMVWSALGRNSVAPGTGALLAAAGAALFMLSDSILALNRFRRPFPGAQVAIMTSYVAAQAMIALSVGMP